MEKLLGKTTLTALCVALSLSAFAHEAPYPIKSPKNASADQLSISQEGGLCTLKVKNDSILNLGCESLRTAGLIEPSNGQPRLTEKAYLLGQDLLPFAQGISSGMQQPLIATFSKTEDGHTWTKTKVSPVALETGSLSTSSFCASEVCALILVSINEGPDRIEDFSRFGQCAWIINHVEVGASAKGHCLGSDWEVSVREPKH